jgi:hypothetical protein
VSEGRVAIDPETDEIRTTGRLEKSAVERIRSQDRADAGMSLNCCVPLEFEFFEVTFISILIH